MIGRKLNLLLELNAMHALYRSDGIWYHNLKLFPGVLFDQNGYIIFTDKIIYESNPALKIRKDLNVAGGISSLSGYQKFSETEFELAKNLICVVIPMSSEEVLREIREVTLRVRNTKLVVYLKKIYDSKCQLCGFRLLIGKKKYYSEVHHIVPLGMRHNGLDTLTNMICVCPNCHILLDLKAIEIDLIKLKFLKHDIAQEFVLYHNLMVTR